MEENPLLSLPRPIIEALFKSAEEEAKRARLRIQTLNKRINLLKPLLKFEKLERKTINKIVAVADGSMSPASNRSIGSDFAVYTAGYMVFDGKSLIDEKYYAGSLSWYEDRASMRTLLRLLMAYAERKAAFEAYEKFSPEFIILDGPFFYFRAHCRLIKGIKLGMNEFETGADLIKKVCDLTLKLMETGRAVCIIRRSVIRAIDGWLIYKTGENSCIGTRDKHILTILMPEGTIWSYSSLLGSECHPSVWAAFYRYYRKLRQAGSSREELKSRKQTLLSQVLADFRRKYRLDLNLDINRIPKTQRYYIRYTTSAPPFEVEVTSRVNVRKFAELFMDFFNPATGLPFPIDMIDSSVSLPRGSTTAFTEEVEARLLRDKHIQDKTVISDYFVYLNPQKREIV